MSSVIIMLVVHVHMKINAHKLYHLYYEVMNPCSAITCRCVRSAVWFRKTSIGWDVLTRKRRLLLPQTPPYSSLLLPSTDPIQKHRYEQ